MRLSQIKKSNRAKLARLEKKGYIFSNEYKQYLRDAKKKIKTTNIRGNVLAIVDKNDKLWIHEKNFGKYYGYDTVQMNKVERYLTQYNNKVIAQDIEGAKEMGQMIFGGGISKKAPKRLTEEQEEMRKQRLKKPETIPEYGTQKYWEWRDFERNRDIFIQYGIDKGLSKEFMEKAANDPGVMYRFNNSDEFIQHYIYDDDLSEDDESTFIDSILGNTFLMNVGETHDSILQALQ